MLKGTIRAIARNKASQFRYLCQLAHEARGAASYGAVSAFRTALEAYGVTLTSYELLTARPVHVGTLGKVRRDGTTPEGIAVDYVSERGHFATAWLLKPNN